MRVLLVHSDARSFEVDRFGRAWRAAGGEDAELTPVTPATAAVRWPATAEAAGVLLTGGPDVEPHRYGRAPLEGVPLHPDPARDALDLGLLDEAERAAVPVLGVCYGCQVVNVFYGGTLVQDLGRAGRSGHYVREPKDFPAHSVTLASDPRWLSALPAEFMVNSRHHQAIDAPAPGLVVIARAPDGVIEAVERVGAERFVVGIQWHPENIAAPPHPSIFAQFRAACLRRAGRA